MPSSEPCIRRFRPVALARLGTVLPVVIALPLLAACEGLFPDVAADAGGSGAAVALEKLDAAGRQALEAYTVASPNKAFAASDGGAWGWQGGETSLTAAQNRALERCEGVAGSTTCHIVAWDVGSGWTAPATPAATGAAPTAAVPDDAAPDDAAPDDAALPVLDDPGVAAFQTFLGADGNKAFAVAPDGAWGWRASSTLPLEAVQEEARANCARHADGCQVVVTAPDTQGLASLPR